MTDEQLREAVARLYEDRCGVRDFWLADAAIALMRPVIRAETLEEAAKVCDVIDAKLTDQWRAGHKVCDYTQGASDGANDCAAAIRALKEKPNE